MDDSISPSAPPLTDAPNGPGDGPGIDAVKSNIMDACRPTVAGSPMDPVKACQTIERADKSLTDSKSGKAGTEKESTGGLRPDVLSSFGREAAGQRIAYRPGEVSRILRPNRPGWESELDLFLDIVAADALDRDIRVVVLIARLTGPAQGRRLAVALGAARPMERIEGGHGLGTVRVSEFIEAVDAAIEQTDDKVGEHVFIDTLTATAADGPVVTALGRASAGHADDDGSSLPDMLRSRRARLVLMVVAEAGQPLLPLLDVLPDAVFLPWTDAWLAQVARARGQSETELVREFGKELRQAACVVDSATSETEATLHLLLQIAPDDEDGSSDLGGWIRGAIEQSRTGKRAITADARALFLRVMRSEDDPAFAGPVGRTILLVALLVPDRPAWAVLELCRHLLPPGPAHTSCLTPVLLETWLRNADDDRVRGEPVREPPGWGAVFDAIRDRVIENIGLVVTAEQKLRPGAKLARLDVRTRFAEQGGRLMELARFALTQTPATALAPDVITVLVDLVAALRRLCTGYLTMADLVSLFAGMRAGDRDLGLPHYATRDILSKLPKDLGSQIRTVDGLSELHAVLSNDDFDRREFEDELRESAAGHLLGVLEIWSRHPDVDECSVGDFLTVLFERIPPASALMVLAYLVLRGVRLQPAALGRLTADQFIDLDREDFTSVLRSFRRIVGKCLGSAVQNPLVDPARIDRWADALWAVRQEAPYRFFGTGLAIWLDDFLSTWEIPTRHQKLDEPDADSCLLARLIISSTDLVGPERDLLCRLFERTPTERLDALRTLAHLAGGPRDEASPALRIEDTVAQRINDVFWIMVGPVDHDESDARALRLDHLEEIVWSTVSRHFRLTNTLDRVAVFGAILGRLNAPTSTGGPDPRVLLDLYAPAVLMYWRFRRFGTRSLSPGDPDYKALLVTLARVAKAIAPPRHMARTATAFRALTEVQECLVTHFRVNGCPRTMTHHEERLGCWRAISNFLVPQTTALVNPSRVQR